MGELAGAAIFDAVGGDGEIPAARREIQRTKTKQAVEVVGGDGGVAGEVVGGDGGVAGEIFAFFVRKKRVLVFSESHRTVLKARRDWEKNYYFAIDLFDNQE
ncbi:hypothetical protein FACS1894107_09960 [Planctomycetales bacterium]|nr:hypothetical protein FACS1894107_09960 [Planctomycetales bacterium]GHS96857.1 hypothetical protein FACS1894108_02230 [Planctomycetales bacterium]